MNVNLEINYCKGLSLYKLQDYAGENYKIVYNHNENKNPGNANTLLIGTIFTCVASDGKLSDTEWNFIAQFIGGYTYDEAFKVASEFYNSEAQKVIKDLYDLFPANVKDAYLKLCIAVLCVDGKIDSKESTLLNSILK